MSLGNHVAVCAFGVLVAGLAPVLASPGFVNMRTAPSPGARVIACLDKGTPIRILGDYRLDATGRAWYPIGHRRFGRGWMAAEYVGFY